MANQITDNTLIDTGAPRSVTGHVVSGAIASAVVAGSINYLRYQKEEITSAEAVRNGLKLTAQGGIATGSAIAAANYLGRNNFLGFLTAIGIGAAGVYGVEQVSRNLEARAAEETEINEIETEEA